MSPTQDYYDWLAAGRPQQTAQPILDLAATLRKVGFTVYIIGDDSHLKASTPEDHTPFSHTGWPIPSPRWWIDALDVMPRNGDMAELTRLAHSMIYAKEDNRPEAAFIKYINWTDENGNVKHISWEPGESEVKSSDSGHIHLSGRTDFLTSTCAAGWNPFDGNPTPPVSPVVHRPAPTPTYEFPLPRGYYFGYASGPNESVSGNYGRGFSGRKDSDWLKLWADQLSKRGWSVGSGKQYLTRYGNDGHYGDEYNKLAKAFQTDQHLAVDGQIGHDTWTAAFHNPIS